MLDGGVSHWMVGTGRTRYGGHPPGAADEVVLGGGYTGLWAAYRLLEAEPGRSVVVCEAEHVGWGASGRNGGWLSHLVPGNPAVYARARGTGAAVALQRAIVDGIDDVLDVCAREEIDVDAVRGGELDLATTPAGAARLAQRRAADLRFGLLDDEIVSLDAAAAHARVHAAGTRGALHYPAVTRIHPGKLVTGLAAAVERRGGVILEGTRVEAVEPGAVRTSAGTVAAGAVLICTEGYTPGRRLAPVNSSMIVTQRLSDAQWARIGWNARECLGDAAHVYCYAQRTADGRIAIGGRGAPYRFGSGTGGDGTTPRRTVQELLGRLRRLFPGVAFEVEHAWSGVLGVTRDWGASVAFDRATGIGSSSGYAGHGVTASAVAARTLVDLALSRDTPFTGLPWVDHASRPWEPEPIRYLGIHGMYRVFRLADAHEERTGRATTSPLARIGGRLAGLDH